MNEDQRRFMFMLAAEAAISPEFARTLSLEDLRRLRCIVMYSFAKKQVETARPPSPEQVVTDCLRSLGIPEA
jgi:hypothetical protein